MVQDVPRCQALSPSSWTGSLIWTELPQVRHATPLPLNKDRLLGYMIAVWRLRNLRCDVMQIFVDFRDFHDWSWIPFLPLLLRIATYCWIVELLLLSATASQLRGDVTTLCSLIFLLFRISWHAQSQGWFNVRFNGMFQLCCFQGSLDQSLQNFPAACRSTNLIFKEQAGLLLGRKWEEVAVSKCLCELCR